jgi:hypothetical protein
MKNDLKILLFIILAAGLFTACSSGGVDPNDPGAGAGHGGGAGSSPQDTTAPVLSVLTPVENQVFNNGNSINVTGSISDDLGLYRGSIRITNDATGQVLKEQLYEIHYVLAYSFNISYTPLVSTASDYTVTVSFEDHGLNSVTKAVKIRVNP